MADYTAPVPVPGKNMGKADARIEGREKVTGATQYASDFPVSNPAFAYLVTSAIANGKIRGFDLKAAKAMPGVVEIFTHENAPKREDAGFFAEGGYVTTGFDPLGSAEVKFAGQIIGVVVAETYEVARDAAHRIVVDYAPGDPSASLESRGTETVDAAKVAKGWKDKTAGDFDKAWDSAEVKIEAGYTTPTQHHNPIELFTTTAVWHGDELTIYEPSQFVWGLKNGVAKQLDVDPAKVTVIAPFVGGAFGSKGMMTPRTGIIAAVARAIHRPVKFVATRTQGFTVSTYRAETRHAIKLGADKSGKLTALSHDGWELTSRTDDYKVGGTEATTQMYAIPNVTSKVHIVRADRSTPGFMRSPPEVPYMFALECAIDEMAEKCGIDPVEFRQINDTMKSPVSGDRFTSRHLVECFDAASEAFGWSKRNPKVGSMRNGDWLVGYGCASTCYPANTMPATARVRLSPDGHARVQIAAHDVGTGATTIMGQVVAEAFDIPLSQVNVEMGDSRLPPGPVAGGSMTTASAGSAVKAACDKVIAKFGNRLPTGDALAAAFKKMNTGVVEEYAEWAPPKTSGGVAKLYEGHMAGGSDSPTPILAYAYGAEFVEVHIHSRTKEIRVPRITGAFAGGRIMNPRTARSQLMGGLIWGVSSALHEATEIDEKRARYVNDNIAEYLIPVNADIRSVEVILVPEVDDQVPMGAKGLGELGNVGTNAAVANAVYHATGQRIRELPITIDKLIA
ncbi:xanthine dehydrogenase family protein molybdopterin-binding subunit [Polymorphobacter sp. PAMC 29334]|uniref:xanthine dehydrogenase family protein molybdopterin-binding subunit n=1 Tax=Polymorphobacter sp. PAMC 29334 TaxID=2862331 RepID=UPI001C67A4E2|nr:xanthine dehydrogenase family protein molybdopterin-binding subunit [Polymorphobacter sp. PAMC 29334]QYE35118.1 xanthine dehydrogenase family protein molybdopterin-binding subunit [Polymorphobacter sp. PAMC 29334]